MKIKNVSIELKKRGKKVPQPSFLDPMLATLTKNYFSNDDWLYEHKFDGERCLAFKKNGVVTLKSRNNNILNGQYPELVTALAKQSADNFILDGEIVSLNTKGVSDFELLQSRMNIQEYSKELFGQKKIMVSYCIFDLPYIDGYDIRAVPLYARKELLKNLLNYNKTLVYSEHVIGKGIPFFKKACHAQWEGLIAKRIESEYTGTRSRDWLKFKCIMQQELIICGYTEPQGTRASFGALLVGYYEKGTLQYAGKVGTGFNADTLELLGKKLKRLETKKCPFDSYNASIKNVHWVKPILVAEFQFAQWTSAGRLRVGRYKGLRDDKDAKDVVREIPKSIGP
jgi:DNA ligase D-like protein (predicted ligase)